MSERYWQRPVPRAAALLAVAGAAVAGCSSSGAGATGSGTTSSAGAANIPASLTATQLGGALLARVNGEPPAAAPQTGLYGKLPDVQTSKQSMHGVTINPAKCAQASVTGFNSAEFADAPASVVTFRVGRDGVSEVIVAASPTTAADALTTELPAGCAHYHATVKGNTYAYAVKEMPVGGIADQARAINVKAAGYADVDVWSVVFRADGYVGAVTIVGPDASEQGAKVLASDAYARATESLR